MNYVGVDLGGTNMTAAVLDDSYAVIAQAKRLTSCPRPYDAILDDVARTVLDAVEKEGISPSDFAYVGVGSPGVVSAADGVVIDAVNLGFKNVPLGSYLSRKLGVRVILENDANAAAYGEFLAGAAKNTNDFVALTIGTGIGSGVILNKNIYRGANGVGGELGHTVVVLDGRPCSCGRKGCMDVYASATGLITSTKEAMRADGRSLLWQLVNGDISAVNGVSAFSAAKQGDETACAVVASYVRVLAACVTNIVNIFQPDMISIAGGVSREGEYLLEPVRALVQSECLKNPKGRVPIICAATLQDKAGVIGAALLGVRNR